MVGRNNRSVFEPHRGVGGIRFGMSREEVHHVLGQPDWRESAADPFGLSREQFNDCCAFVDFDREGRCCGVEAYPDATVLLDGRDLMAMDYGDLVAFLHARQILVVETGDGFRADAIGLACYAPSVADPEATRVPIESLLLYRRGYYDEVDAHLATMNRA